MKEFEDQVDSTAKKSGTSLQGLFEKVKRPVEMIAFSGLAQQLDGVGMKGQSAGLMIERGLKVAGTAMLAFEATSGIGMAIIAATALYEVFNRIHEASLLTADGIEKLIATNDKAAKSFRDAAKEASKSSGRKDVILDLNQQALALDKLTANTKAQAKTEMDAARAQLQLVLTGKDAAAMDERASQGRVFHEAQLRRITAAQKVLQEATKTYTAVLADNALKEQATSDIMKKRGDILHDLYLKTATHVQLVKDLATAQTRMDQLDHQILATTDPEKLKAMEAEHEALMKLVQDYKTYAKQTEDSSKAQMDWAQLAVGLAQDTQKAITAALDGGKKAQKSILEAMGRDMLKTTGESLQKMLQAKAIAAFADPLTVPIGIAELAASAIIGGLTGAIGGGGGDTATPAPSAATGQNNVQTPAANGNQGNQTMLQVYVQGGVIDDNFAANLAKRLSDVVQFNNVQLVSSFSRS